MGPKNCALVGIVYWCYLANMIDRLPHAGSGAYCAVYAFIDFSSLAS